MSYKGFIYAIKSQQTDDVYVGSTKSDLNTRFSQHKCGFKKYLRDSKGYATCYEILKYDDAYIELLEECSCESRKALVKKEGEYMIKLNSINKCIGGRTRKEYKDINKEKIAQQQRDYIEKNIERIRERRRKYREANKERIKKYAQEYDKKRREKERDKLVLHSKEYYAKNKETILDKQREYYQSNKERIKERVKRYYENKKK